jgi:signal transduction histidine kinase
MSPTTIRRTSAIAFGLVAIAVIIVSAFAYRTLRRSDEANKLVAHTYQVLNALERVTTAIVDAETGVRGFAIGGVRRYLEPFNRANRELVPRIEAVASLTADNPVQQRNVSDLRIQASTTMQVLQQMISLKESNEGIPSYLSEREKESMDTVRATLQRMRIEEQDFLVQRNQSAASADVWRRVLVVSLIAAAFTVLAVSFLFVDRRAVQVSQLNRSLAERVRERTTKLEQALTDEQQARQQAEHAQRREQQARAEADAANRSKDVFVARVSHELRTPLNALMGWARMLHEGQLPAERVGHAVAAIDRNGEVLKTLVDDLVDMSRISTGTLQLNRQNLEVAALVQESLNLLEPAARAESIMIETDIESRPMFIDGDSTRLRQVLWNLLSNAIKFTPARGRVLLTVRPSGEEVEIRVTDKGQGIAPEFLAHVFEPFSQADSSGHGLGLGLAVVHQLVKAHGGRVDVMSDGVGAGTTFTVLLPMVQVPEGV